MEEKNENPENNNENNDEEIKDNNINLETEEEIIKKTKKILLSFKFRF